MTITDVIAPGGSAPAGSPASPAGRPVVVGSLGACFTGVQRIAVLRGGGLGDLLFALPAVQALAAAYPDAEVRLLGTPLHAALLNDRPGPVSAVDVLPVVRGVREVPGEEEAGERTDRFVSRMARSRFDLAVQLHGGGRWSNPFLSRLGARHTAGTATPDAQPLERVVPYVYYQHEVLRALEVVAAAGAPAVGLEPVVTVTSGDREAARPLLGGHPVVAMHPGATDPRRRWPAECFAATASAVAARGAQVVLVGDGSDAATAQQIVEMAQRSLPATARPLVSSAAGRLSIGGLVGLLAEADVMVGNDSGPRHLAQAVGTATVGIYWVGNLINAGPLSRGRHRVHLGWITRCPTCGRDATQVGWTHPRCEHDDSFVADVGPGPVLDDIEALLRDRTP